MINKQSYQIQGMRQDNLVGTGFSSKFAHEIKNLRLNTIGDYTTACWTTEKGTKEVTIQRAPNSNWITDKTYSDGQIGEQSPKYVLENFEPIGQAVINDYWILFGTTYNDDDITKTNHDTIICINCTEEEGTEKFYGRILYWGKNNHDLNFNTEYPIETVVYYENENIQKVYWTDGLNQPRMINIKGNITADDNTQFDFVRELELTESLDVYKLQNSGGLFPPCSVKYAVTYYKENGQESNIVATSTLVYPTKGERGCAPNELSSDAFEVRINSINSTTKSQWDYARLYSIVRTSDNATPIVRIVDDKRLSDAEYVIEDFYTIKFTDTNTTGRIIDPNIIFYLGGRNCVVETIEQKDNVLFYGNIKLQNKSITALKSELKLDPQFEFTDASSEYKEIQFANRNELSFYAWKNQLNPIVASNKLKSPKIFKTNEYYKIGIQFQDKYGVWSEILPLGESQNTRNPIIDIDVAKFPKVKYTLNSTQVGKLLDNGYKRARLACCFPDNSNRRVIAQGVMCPTLSNNKWESTHSPDRIASWFYRFSEPYTSRYNAIPVGEVQSMNWRDELPVTKYDTRNTSDNRITADNVFKINWDTCTLHTPDIEFDETLQTLNLLDAKIKLLDYSYPTSYTHKLFLEYSEKAYDYLNNQGKGFIDNGKKESNTISGGIINNLQSVTFLRNQIKTEYGYWNDINVYNSNYLRRSETVPGMHQINFDTIDYNLYPFQRKYLNNYVRDLTINIPIDQSIDTDYTIKESSILNTKIWSTLNFSLKKSESFTTRDITPIDIKIFNTAEEISLRLNKKVSATEEDKFYFGNVNAIAPILTDRDELRDSIIRENMGLRRWESYGYKITVDSSAESEVEDNLHVFATLKGAYEVDYIQHISAGTSADPNHPTYPQVPISTTPIGVSSDPIQIKYKSTPHVVVSFNEYDDADYGNAADYIRNLITSQSDDCLLIAELFREIPASSNNTKNNLNDIYIPCSTSYRLVTGQPLPLYHDEGDTYYMRYDNLKTYPYANDDVNQIVEIYSFMCETRVNLDGRYDENRGLTDNTIVNNTNFNLINKSYTQTDNIFSYKELDELSASLDNFPNQISFSSPKVAGEETDAWTNITLASTFDVNGSLGKINRIENINNNLILFQDHGVARIKYNENTAISTTNGEPLELAKTNKLDGVDYVSTHIGCQNKWSISNTKNGLFWIDDSRQELMAYNGQSIDSFSPLVGMESFMIKNLPTTFTKWNPKDFDNFVTYYDKLSNDVYYINNTNCLAWNEEAKNFTSFYDYNAVPYMTNLGNHSLMWRNGVWAAREADTYSTFFGGNKDYWITIVCDGQTSEGSAFPADKVFNNIEYRADVFNMNYGISDNPHTNYNTSVFNRKQAWNGYQNSQEVPLDGIRKFNTWRVQLPRHYGTKDRIRNPFCYIKLRQTQSANTQTDRMILHDLAVYFDMK